MYIESSVRTLMKTVSWRLWSTLATIILVLLFTERVDLAITVGGFEVGVKMFLYFFHERVWSRLKFGLKEHNATVYWITGLSRSGTRELANGLASALQKKGVKVETLGGEQIQNILPQTGFTSDDRARCVERVGYLASQFEKHGISVVASLVSPHKNSRDFVRSICKNFVEIYVSTPLELCEERCDKGNDVKARKGFSRNFVGVDIPYEPPVAPDVDVDLSQIETKDAVNLILAAKTNQGSRDERQFSRKIRQSQAS